MARARFATDRDLQIYILIAVVAVVSWWPTRELPYHWDAASFVVEAARDLRATHFFPFVAGHSDFAHPPLFVALLALAWSVFGERAIVSHLVVFPWLPIAMAATYRLGRLVAGRGVGLAAALAFALAPVAQAEYGQIYLDLPMAALTTAGLCAWACRRPLATATFFALAVWTKLPATLVPAALLASNLLRARHTPPSRRDVCMYVALVVPLAAMILWLENHRLATGWWLSVPGRQSSLPTSWGELEGYVRGVCWRLFVVQGRLVVTAVAAIASTTMFVRMRTRSAWPIELPTLATLAAIPLAGGLAFACFGEVAQRYCLFLFPPLFVATFAAVRAASTTWATGPTTAMSSARSSLVRAAPLVVASLAVLVAEGVTMHPRRQMEAGYSFLPDENLGMRDMIAVGRLAAEWVQKAHPDARVFGSFPESYQLTEPYQGYVDAPITFAECSTVAEPAAERSRSGQVGPDLIYIHRYYPGQMACNALANATHAKPVKLFNVNGHWIEIRRVPQDGS